MDILKFGSSAEVTNSGGPPNFDRTYLAFALFAMMTDLLDTLGKDSSAEDKKQSGNDPYELGEAFLKLQTESASLHSNAPPYTSTPHFLGIDFIKAIVPSRGIEEDLRVIHQLASENDVSTADVQKLWSWTPLPYSIRCAGLAKVALLEKSVEVGEAGGFSECVVDQDDWFVLIAGDERLAYVR